MFRKRYKIYFSVNWLNYQNLKKNVNGKFKSENVENICVLLPANVVCPELSK